MNRDIYCPERLLGLLRGCVLDANNLLSGDLKEKIWDSYYNVFPYPLISLRTASFCPAASGLSREVIRMLLPRVTPSLSGTPLPACDPRMGPLRDAHLFPFRPT